ncbi:hypothetical protein [Devosia submarina]|uniref:hypothetical protein n=1 Tax=Devosia submarina TaxID=1173082 RepID=UPI00130056DE|nr:hypothetical protein [Devosia submarina]
MPEFIQCRPDQIPSQAVVVHAWHAMGRVVADVACSNCPRAEDYVIADFPRPVPLAIARAVEVCQICGLETIAVVVEEGLEWRRDWAPLKRQAEALSA